MKYYSTNKQAPLASLEDAVIKGLANDRGLYMPEEIKVIDPEVIRNMKNMSFHEIACIVARAFFGDDIEAETLDRIVKDTLSFEIPVVHIAEHIYTLELFHGPTLAFKDVGARFMARLLGYFIRKKGLKDVNVLVATSGDTGSAVANGFLGVEGIHVYVLYPKGKVSPVQECQFTTLGRNITAIEIDGTFDDCQALVKSAFMDKELNSRMQLTSANSINVARLLPQSFYYFNAYAQLDKAGKADNLIIVVPSGNFGNLTAGLFAHRMGLPVKRFIAANNRNDVFLKYLNTGRYNPCPSVSTIANAMDVGDPSNFARITDLYGNDEDTRTRIKALISCYSFTDDSIAFAMRWAYETHRYLLDPHGACGYAALQQELTIYDTGLILETAHPAKFKDTVDKILKTKIDVPSGLKAFMEGEKQTTELSKDFASFKNYLLNAI